MNLNLAMAVFWLVLGVVLLVGPQLDPQMRPWSRFGLNVGWLALALTFYNLVRWWSVRAARARRQKRAEAQRHEAHEHRPVQETDPTLDFSDGPPRPGTETRESGG